MEYDRLQNRIHTAYVDKLDGTIDPGFFEKISKEWRAEQSRCLRDIERQRLWAAKLKNTNRPPSVVESTAWVWTTSNRTHGIRPAPEPYPHGLRRQA